MNKNDILSVQIDFNPESNDLTELVKSAIKDSLSEFMIYGERLIDNGDVRQTVLDIELTDFNFDKEILEGDMTFQFGVDFYIGCKDMNSYDVHNAEQSFPFNVNVIDGKIIFDEVELPRAWQPDLMMD